MSTVIISNKSIDNVEWLPPEACTYQLKQCADVWRINIRANLGRLKEYSEIINHAEHSRAARYLHARDKERFIISRGVLRSLFSRYIDPPPQAIIIENGANKKPYIKDYPVHYNLSHSGDMILIAISDSAIGVDVERIDPGFDFNDIINEYFSTGEQKFIKEENSLSRFLTLWTRKEAITKATGKGLDDDLKNIPSLEGDFSLNAYLLNSNLNWHVTSFHADSNHIGSLALPVEFQAPKYLDWDTQ